MQQMYPCPRCGAPVKYGSRFCGNCGNTLQLEAPPPPYGSQYPNQPQPWGQQQPPYNQQPGWNQPPPYNQAGSPNPYQQQNTYGYRGAMPQKKSSSRGIAFLVILIVIMFTVGGIALATNGSFFSSSKPAGNTPPSTTPTSPAETPPSSKPAPPEPTPPQAPALPASQATPITAKELIAAYTNDRTSATAQYQGNGYAISGIVSGAKSSPPPFLYLNDGTPNKLEIQCNFSQGQEANIASLNVGQAVKVEGRIINFIGSIIVVDNCRLVQ